MAGFELELNVSVVDFRLNAMEVDMLGLARRRDEARGLHNLQLLEGRAESIPADAVSTALNFGSNSLRWCAISRSMPFAQEAHVAQQIELVRSDRSPRASRYDGGSARSERVSGKWSVASGFSSDNMAR